MREPSGATPFSAVVVAYRSADVIGPCLLALLHAAGATDVVVIDNSADDCTRRMCEQISEEHPGQVAYHAPTTNLGYARGINLGASMVAATPWILIANADVVIDAPLSPLITIGEMKGAAVVSGIVRAGRRGATNVRRTLTPALALAGSIVGSRASEASMHGDAPRRVGQLDGACLLIRRGTFDALNGLDDQLELYFDDVDLCDRVQGHGGSWLVPVEIGTHIGGHAVRTVGDDAYLLYRVSRLRYLRKRYGARGTGVAVLATVLEILTRGRNGISTRTRLKALRLVLLERASPGSVWILDTSRHDG